MTDNNHPITPPPELILEWCRGWNCTSELTALRGVASQAARWGADQELKACCEWLLDHGYDLCSPEMRKDRRPKPPSLKERALEAHERSTFGKPGDRDIIRRALESLPD